MHTLPQALNTKRQYDLDMARVITLFAFVLNHAVSRSFAAYRDQMAEFNAIPLFLTLLKAAGGNILLSINGIDPFPPTFGKRTCFPVPVFTSSWDIWSAVVGWTATIRLRWPFRRALPLLFPAPTRSMRTPCRQIT